MAVEKAQMPRDRTEASRRAACLSGSGQEGISGTQSASRKWMGGQRGLGSEGASEIPADGEKKKASQVSSTNRKEPSLAGI